MTGFETSVFEKLDIQVSVVRNLKVQLKVGSTGETVDVTANGVQTDTVSSALVAVVDQKSVQDIPLNGRNFTQMVHLSAGVSAYTNSVNGSRSQGVNFKSTVPTTTTPGPTPSPPTRVASQVSLAVSCRSRPSISFRFRITVSLTRAATVAPIRTWCSAPAPTASTATSSISTAMSTLPRSRHRCRCTPACRKSATTRVALPSAVPSGVTTPSCSSQAKSRIANANNSIADTVVNNAWISDATRLLALHSLKPNTVSTNLYNLLFPADSKGGSATTGNYTSVGRNTYNSYNGVIKLDHTFNSKHQLSIRYLGTTGTQSADVGSHYSDYFQTAPMHIHNVSIVANPC